MGERSSHKTELMQEASGEAVDLIEITGVIKWFDVAKGFGSSSLITEWVTFCCT